MNTGACSSSTGAAFPGLPGRYRIQRALGHGADKRVYLAHDDVLDRAVAIASVDAPADGSGAGRRLDEARAMARLGDLPHVVSIYDVVDAGERLYIVSQYLPGGDLGSHLRATPAGTLPVRRAIEIAAQISQALDGAHEHGIYHRDVKPQNVFLDADGATLLGDFGLAEDATRGARSVHRVGTLAYTAPEQAWGEPADPRSDLYALGCLLYELLTGRPPFVADSPAELLYMHEQEPPVPPSDRNPAVPALVSELVLKLLAKRREDRPASAADVRAALEGLYRALGSVEPLGDESYVLGSASPSLRSAASIRLESPFVGRGDEMRVLEETLRSASAGEPAVVLVPGEPGAGKTRLLRELSRRADDAGAVVLLGQSSEDVRLPDQPFIDALLPLAARLSELDPGDAALLRRFLQLDARRREPEEPAPVRHHIHGALERALERFSASRPILLAIDDLHWCDHASLDLFQQLALDLIATPHRPRRIVLLGTHRFADAKSRAGRLLEHLAREPGCMTLLVPGLDENDLHALLEGLGVERPANQLIHLLHGATAGNPLFVREVVRHLESRGEIARRAGFAVSRSTALQIPSTAATVISARVRALPEHTRQLLAVGGLVGRRFELGLLAAVTGEDEDQVIERLDAAVVGGLVVDEGQAYAFAHPVIRQTCVGLLPRTRRERVHLRIALHLRAEMQRRQRADGLPLIAHHLVRAGAAAGPPLVCEFARRAADLALESGAWHEAAELLDAVLDADARGDALTPLERAHVHRSAGFAYLQLSDEGPCFAHLDAAIAGFQTSGDAAGLAAALSERTRGRVVFGKVAYSDFDDVKLLEHTLAHLDDDLWRLRAVALSALSITYWAAGISDRAEDLARAGLALARAHGDDSLCAERCWDLAAAQQQSGHLREALESCRTGLEHARRTGIPASAATCLQRMPLILFMLGRLDEVETTVREARELHRTAFSTGDESVALAMLAALEATRGAFADAERWVDEAMRLHDRIGYSWGALLALVTRAHCHAVRGERDAAIAAFDEMVRPGRIFEDPSAFAATLEPNRLLIDAYTGRRIHLDPSPAGFLPAPTGSGARLDAYLLTAYCFQVELAVLANRPDLAAPLEAVLALAEERGIVFTIAWPLLVARVRGLAAAIGGRSHDAERHFERAARQASQCGAHPELGRTLLDHGRLLLGCALNEVGDERARALALLRRAKTTLEQCGMTGFAAQAEALCASAGPST